MKKSILLVLTIFAFIHANAQCLEIIGFEGTNPDAVYLRAADNISGGTVFYFTDNEWVASTESFNNLNEQEATWQVPQDGISVGSIIKISGSDASCGNVISGGVLGIGGGDELYVLTKEPSSTTGEITASDICFAYSAGGNGDIPVGKSVNTGNSNNGVYNGSGDITDANNWTTSSNSANLTFPQPSCTNCGVEFGTPTFTCDSFDNNPNADFLYVNIPYTGVDANITSVSVTIDGNSDAVDTSSQDPSTTEDGTITVYSNEGAVVVVTLNGGGCDGQSITINVPSNQCVPLDITITEILYDVCDLNTNLYDGASGTGDANGEYIVVRNNSSTNVADLTGQELSVTSGGTPIVIPAGTAIPAGESMIITSMTQAQYEAEYGVVPSNFSLLTLSSWNPLNNGGDTVNLTDALNSGFTYSDLAEDGENLIWNGNTLEFDLGSLKSIACQPSATPELVITEIMYNSPGSDDEWVEICNIGTTDVVLEGYVLNVFTFPAGATLVAGDCIVVSLGSDGDGEYNSGTGCSFTPDYGVDASTSDTNSLTNSSGTITLSNNTGSTIDVVTYNDSNNATDGNGATYHVIDATLDNSNTSTNWTAVTTGGSPGVNSTVPTCPGICNITFGTPTFVCDTNDNNPNTDFLYVNIPYTGLDADITNVSVTIDGIADTVDTSSQDPSTTQDGTISVYSNEGAVVVVTLNGGGCDGESITVNVPENQCAQSSIGGEITFQMINPCGNDGDNEFVVFTSGDAPITINDIALGSVNNTTDTSWNSFWSTSNTGGSGPSITQNGNNVVTSVSGSGAYGIADPTVDGTKYDTAIAELNAIAGGALFVSPDQTTGEIPANSNVVFFLGYDNPNNSDGFDNAADNLDFTAQLPNAPLYIILGQGTSTSGYFSNTYPRIQYMTIGGSQSNQAYNPVATDAPEVLYPGSTETVSLESCPIPETSLTEEPCTQDASTDSPVSTQIGISTLDRNLDDWLPKDLSAYIVLESTVKGFVITRNADPDNNIVTPEEGMIVWDTTAKCLKMYFDKNNDGTMTWNCISSTCNQ